MHHQDDQQQQQQQQPFQPAIKIDGRPVLIRHKSSATTTIRSTTIHPSSSSRADRHAGKINGGYRDAVSDSELSVSSVSSVSDSEMRRRRGTARNESMESRDRGAGVGGPSYPTRQWRSQNQPPQAIETDVSNTNNTNNDHDDDDEDDEQHPPEWKLHVTLCKLDKEVQQLRKSHLDLSGKLERLGSSSNLQSASSTAAAAAADETGSLSLEEQEKKRQQRRQLRLQLQRVVDSLEEKAEEILRLQHYLLEQQQRQQQQQESHEQSESIVSRSSRLTRKVRKPSAVTVEDDAGQDGDDLSIGERQFSGDRGLRVHERFRHRVVNGS